MSKNYNMLKFLFTIVLLVASLVRQVQAEGPRFPFVSNDEFKSLALRLAPKVTLFSDIWKEDPKAAFFGGTSRDFLYWILGQLQGIKSPAELKERMRYLDNLSVIDIRNIVGIESDIDVITTRRFLVDPSRYGVRKIDSIDPSRLNPETQIGRNEIDQGFISVEKIRLSKNEIGTPEYLGDGVQDLISGKLQIKFSTPSTFWNSYYAQNNLNHPLLLAIRYLRILAHDYYRIHGSDVPDLKVLLNYDPSIRSKIKELFKSTLGDPKFEALLKQKQGLRWLNSSILKSFRSYTNPTAAYELFKDAGFNELIKVYSQIESINQFLFLPYRDQIQINAEFQKYNTTPERLLTKAQNAIPQLKLIHGTRTIESFRAILLQNILPSRSGTAGSGLYATEPSETEFVESFTGAKDLIVVLDISSQAKIFDLTRKRNQSFQQNWLAQNPGADLEAFYRAFGIDVVIYPYHSTNSKRAFLIKNSAVILGRQGLTRKIFDLNSASKEASQITNVQELNVFSQSLSLNGFSETEMVYIFRAIPEDVFNLISSRVDLRNLPHTVFIYIALRAKQRSEFIDRWIQQNFSQLSSALLDSFFKLIPLASREKSLILDNLIESYNLRCNPSSDARPCSDLYLYLYTKADLSDRQKHRLFNISLSIRDDLRNLVSFTFEKEETKNLIERRTAAKKLKRLGSADADFVTFLSDDRLSNIPPELHPVVRSWIDQIIDGNNEDLILNLLRYDTLGLLRLARVVSSDEYGRWISKLAKKPEIPFELQSYILPMHASSTKARNHYHKDAPNWIKSILKNTKVEKTFKRDLIKAMSKLKMTDIESAKILAQEHNITDFIDVHIATENTDYAFELAKEYPFFKHAIAEIVRSESPINNRLDRMVHQELVISVLEFLKSPILILDNKTQAILNAIDPSKLNYEQTDSYIQLLSRVPRNSPFYISMLVKALTAVSLQDWYLQTGSDDSLDILLRKIMIKFPKISRLKRSEIEITLKSIDRERRFLQALNRIKPSFVRNIRKRLIDLNPLQSERSLAHQPNCARQIIKSKI